VRRYRADGKLREPSFKHEVRNKLADDKTFADYVRGGRFRYLWTIRHSFARIAGNPIT
jgi:hypothetical protein